MIKNPKTINDMIKELATKEADKKATVVSNKKKLFESVNPIITKVILEISY